MTLFPHGGNIATNATKELSSRRTAKAARDLLLDFDHANISLSLTIVKCEVDPLLEGRRGDAGRTSCRCSR
jgi:hypothetical protein